MIFKNFINNEWCDAQNCKTFEVINPFTEKVITNVPASDEKDVEIAVEAAKNAFYDWSNLTAGERRDHYEL